MNIDSLAYGLIGIIAGAAILKVLELLKAKKLEEELQKKSDQVLDKAKKDASDIKYNARKDGKTFIKEERERLDKERKQKLTELADQEKSLNKKEFLLEQKIEIQEKEIERVGKKEQDLEEKRQQLSKSITEYKDSKEEYVNQLTQVASFTKEEAKQVIIESMTEEARVDAAKKITIIEEEAKEESEKRAKRIVGLAIQRFAGEYVSEKTITSVELPSDDIKGRLIGREGRNIRAFEQICGVDLLIDDTPEIVVISSFNVIRREVARLTIQKLIADGRIHPAKIEEFYDKSKAELDAETKELGEKAQMEIGVHGIHPEILKLVGALNWRTSYTQNQYQHALEAAQLCGAMAAELGLNVKQARRAGLLHDIGKVIDASAEGSHAVIGADFAKKYGESPDVVHAIRAHHDDEKPMSVLAHLVASSDAISGARPGARKAMMESYISRLTDIERIVDSFEGVSKSYAISAGREIRVLVQNDKVDDSHTINLSRDIAKKIEEEMSYPGTIKITVIRETRAVGMAK